MAPEPSESSDERDAFTIDRFSDYSFGFSASTDGGFGSTDSAFSTPHTASSRGNSSVPRSSQAEDIYEWSNEHFQRQSHHGHLDNGFGSTDSAFSTPHTSSSRGNSSVPRTSQAEDPFDVPRVSDSILDPPGDGFLFDDDCDPMSLLDNYTFNQALPAGSHHNNNTIGLQQVTCGPGYSMRNDFSDQMPWNADDHFVPVSQTPGPSFGQEATVPRQLFTPLIEGQNVPRLMVTYRSIAPRTMNATESPNMFAQEETSQYSMALGICEVPSFDVGPGLLGPIANADLSANYPNTTPPAQDNLWPLNPVATSCYENSPSTTTQLISTLHSGSAFAEMGENRSGSTTMTNLVPSRRRENVPILPAPEKSHPGTLHASNGLAHRQQVYGPQEVQPRHSDRRKLTEQERENAKEVREKGACLVCTVKKRKCNNKKICEACLKMAKLKHLKLVPEHICLPRAGILAFRQGILDFFYTNTRVGNPLNLPTTLQGPWRTIIIGDRVGANNVLLPKKVPLIVRVQEYETYDLDTNLVWSEGSRKSAVASYTIDRSTLPTALKLEEWGRNLFLEASEVPDFRPYIMDKFLFAYWNAKPSLRYHHLVDLTIRLVALSSWLYESHPITSVENVNNQNLPPFSIRDDRIERRLSGVARSQLLLIAAKEFEATEEKILCMVDSLMRSPGCSPQNAVIPGLCLRRMAVLYRLAFKRYKKFVNDSWMLQKAEKPKAMYEALTTAYSLIYSGAKNAFSIEWRVEDCLGAFGNDRELSDLFVKVMNYDREYCQRNLNDEDDVHLKILFLERKKGGGPRSR